MQATFAKQSRKFYKRPIGSRSLAIGNSKLRPTKDTRFIVTIDIIQKVEICAVS
jgi:hypothetical protein